MGPFVLFDHFGPDTLAGGANGDVGPHPHICRTTVTYVFVVSFTHRDSLVTVQEILPGALSWMSAGRGACTACKLGLPPLAQQTAVCSHGAQHPQSTG